MDKKDVYFWLIFFVFLILIFYQIKQTDIKPYAIYSTDIGDIDNDQISEELVNTFIRGYAELRDNKILIASDELNTRQDLNKDNDLNDIVLNYFDLDTKELTNLGIDIGSGEASISNNIIAYTLSESENNEDYNQDNDLKDFVLFYYNIYTKEIINTNQQVYSRWRGSIPTITGTSFYEHKKGISHLQSYKNIIVFSVSELDLKQDLNLDGDIRDILIRYYNIDTKEIKIVDSNFDISRGFVIDNNIIIFTIRESKELEDYNNNGDMTDHLITYFNIDTGKLKVTKQKMYNGDYLAFDYPYVMFLVQELNLASDINNDGDFKDYSPLYYNIETEQSKKFNLGLSIRTGLGKDIIAFEKNNILKYYNINEEKTYSTLVKLDNVGRILFKEGTIYFTKGKIQYITLTSHK